MSLGEKAYTLNISNKVGVPKIEISGKWSGITIKLYLTRTQTDYCVDWKKESCEFDTDPECMSGGFKKTVMGVGRKQGAM